MIGWTRRRSLLLLRTAFMALIVAGAGAAAFSADTTRPTTRARIAGRLRSAARASASVRGVVTGASSEAFPSVLTLQTSFGERELTLEDTTRFALDGVEGSPGQPPIDPAGLVGRWVDVGFDENSRAVLVDVQTRVRVSAPVLKVTNGHVPTVLTIAMPFGGPIPLTVDSSTSMPNTDANADLRELRGGGIWTEFDPETMTATLVLPEPDTKRFQGRIFAVHPDLWTIDVESGSRMLTLQVQPFLEDSPGAIKLNFRDARLADLQAGLDVIVDYVDAEGLEASSIQAIEPGSVSLISRVGKVSTSSQTITLNLRSRPAQEMPSLLKLAPGARISIDGHRGSLSEIEPGARLRAKVLVVGGVAYARSIRVSHGR